MKKIDYFENLLAAGDKLSPAETYLTRAYMDSLDKGYELIALDDIIWDHQWADFFSEIKKSGIDAFAFTCGSSGALETLAAMIDFGFSVSGSYTSEIRRAPWPTFKRGLIVKTKAVQL